MRRFRTVLAILAGTGLSLLAGRTAAATTAVFSINVSMLTPPGLTATKYQTPAAPVIGQPVTYAIVVTNAGAATVAYLMVVDTVASQVTGVSTAEPAGFGAPAATGVPGGTRYVWNATGLTFGPGQTYT